MKNKIAIMAWAVMLSASVFADVHYNSKTFDSSATTSEKVYIGHENGEGETDDVLVTVKNDATWTAENYVSVGCVANKSAFLEIESGGAYVSSSYLIVGGASDAFGFVTNNGTMTVANIYMAPNGQYDLDKKAGWQFKTARFDNFGTVNLSTLLAIGQCAPSKTDVELESSLFYNHEGAVLNLTRTTGEVMAIGRRSPGRMLNEGIVNCNSGLTIHIGQKYVDGSKGILELKGASRFIPGKETIVGSATSSVIEKKGVGYGYLLMSGNSFFGQENATVKLGNSYYANAVVLLEDNAKLSVSNLYICNSDYVNAKITMKGNSVLEHFGHLAIAGGNSSTGCVELIDHSMTSFPTNIYISTGSKSVGTFRLGGATHLILDKEVRFGTKSSSTANFELIDTSSLTVPGAFEIRGYASGASACVSVSDDAVLFATNGSSQLLVGCIPGNYGCLKLDGRAKVLARDIKVAYPDSSQSDSMRGDFEIAGSAVVTNVAQISLGRGSKAQGLLKMRGGSLFLDYRRELGNSIVLGSNGGYTDGVIRGWGYIGFDDPVKAMLNYKEHGFTWWAGMTFCGRIIADGEGVECTLDFSRGPVATYLADSYNSCGTNGFYAVNKGKFKFQRSLPRHAVNHKQIGIKPDNSSPLMVNGFQYTFDDITMNTLGKYVFSELYAVDRSDIPAGLPSGKGFHPSAVWRMGYFNETATPEVDDGDLMASHKQNFSTLKLKFHYDPALAEIEDVRHVKVYRCTDTANGGWRCVASITAPDPSSPYIETVEMAPSSELWNGGWFAVVGTPKVGTVMVLR